MVYHYNATYKDTFQNMTQASIKNMRIGDYLHKGNMKGKATMFNIWNYKIDLKRYEEFADCNPLVSGNLFNWTKTTIQIVGAAELEDGVNTPCDTGMSKFVLLPIPTNYDTSFEDCKRIGGKLVAFKTVEEYEEVSRIYTNQTTCRDRFHIWSAFSDRYNEGQFVDENDTAINVHNFAIGEPNGEDIENCAVIDLRDGKYGDVGCFEFMCGVCKLEELPWFQLRGRFPETYSIDTYFYWTGKLLNDKFVFAGAEFNELTANTKGEWILKDTKTKKKILQLKNYHHPIGRFNWIDLIDNSTLTLAFDTCNAEQFNCGNGVCISKRNRCNQYKDCIDNSDEEDCSFIQLPNDYNKDIPPLGPAEAARELMINVPTLNLHLEDVLDSLSMIKIRINMVSVWRDNRIMFKDLYTDSITMLSDIEKGQIWIPSYTLWNTDTLGLKEIQGFQTLVVKNLTAGIASDKTYSVAHTGYVGDKVDIHHGKLL